LSRQAEQGLAVLYDLDGVSVETPGEGRYWVAPNAVLLGKVRLE
jgi:hypothetical protein